MHSPVSALYANYSDDDVKAFYIVALLGCIP